MMKLRILIWEDDIGLSRLAHCNPKGLNSRDTVRSYREKGVMAEIEGKKVGMGFRSQGVWVAREAGKGKEKDSLPEL